MLCLHNTDENSVLCMMVVTNKFETEAASSRAAALRTWLDSGSFLVEDLQTLMGHSRPLERGYEGDESFNAWLVIYCSPTFLLV